MPPQAPPILVGGAGERRTLRLAARYADACNVFDIPDDGATVRHKLEVLARHCAEVGRDPAEIETTMSSRLAPAETADDLASRARTAADWGIEHLVLVTSTPWAPTTLDLVAEAANQIVDVGDRPWFTR